MKINRPDKSRPRGQTTEQDADDSISCKTMDSPMEEKAESYKPDNGDSNAGAEGEE